MVVISPLPEHDPAVEFDVDVAFDLAGDAEAGRAGDVERRGDRLKGRTSRVVSRRRRSCRKAVPTKLVTLAAETVRRGGERVVVRADLDVPVTASGPADGERGAAVAARPGRASIVPLLSRAPDVVTDAPLIEVEAAVMVVSPVSALFEVAIALSATNALGPAEAQFAVGGDRRDLAAREFDQRVAGQVDVADRACWPRRGRPRRRRRGSPSRSTSQRGRSCRMPCLLKLATLAAVTVEAAESELLSGPI